MDEGAADKGCGHESVGTNHAPPKLTRGTPRTPGRPRMYGGPQRLLVYQFGDCARMTFVLNQRNASACATMVDLMPGDTVAGLKFTDCRKPGGVPREHGDGGET